MLTQIFLTIGLIAMQIVLVWILTGIADRCGCADKLEWLPMVLLIIFIIFYVWGVWSLAGLIREGL